MLSLGGKFPCHSSSTATCRAPFWHECYGEYNVLHLPQKSHLTEVTVMLIRDTWAKAPECYLGSIDDLTQYFTCAPRETQCAAKTPWRTTEGRIQWHRWKSWVQTIRKGSKRTNRKLCELEGNASTWGLRHHRLKAQWCTTWAISESRNQTRSRSQAGAWTSTDFMHGAEKDRRLAEAWTLSRPKEQQ